MYIYMYIYIYILTYAYMRIFNHSIFTYATCTTT